MIRITKKIALISAILATSSVGLAGPVRASMATITNTGQGSVNVVNEATANNLNKLNNNLAVLANLNNQVAASGAVNLFGNTNVTGGALSGAASNVNTNGLFVGITNGAALQGSLGVGNNTSVIDTTGQGSVNTIANTMTNTWNLTNNNTVVATNTNTQAAVSGAVTVVGNTNVTGSATSGNATNQNTTQTGIQVTNTAPAIVVPANATGNTSTIDTTGQGSVNTITNTQTNTVNATNTNTTTVTNTNTQSATSGAVTVSGNTNVGGATSGAASNTGDTTSSVVISN